MFDPDKTINISLQTDSTQYVEPVEEKTEVERKRRLRRAALASTSVKYVWSASYPTTIHDKSCPLISNIADKNFRWSGEFQDSKRRCPVCARSILIRSTLPPELNTEMTVTLFRAAFKSLNATTEDIDVLLNHYGAKLFYAQQRGVAFTIETHSWYVESKPGAEFNLYLSDTDESDPNKSFRLYKHCFGSFRSVLQELGAFLQEYRDQDSSGVWAPFFPEGGEGKIKQTPVHQQNASENRSGNAYYITANGQIQPITLDLRTEHQLFSYFSTTPTYMPFYIDEQPYLMFMTEDDGNSYDGDGVINALATLIRRNEPEESVIPDVICGGVVIVKDGGIDPDDVWPTALRKEEMDVVSKYFAALERDIQVAH